MTKRKRKALGKGMDEIFPGIGQESDAGVSRISVSMIDPNPFQPRKEWNREDILSLAESIRSQGILQPLVVRRKGDRYQLIAGERRLRASKEAGLKDVPVLVREATDQQMLALALVENIQRRDLGPVEKAEAFRRLSDEFDLTQEDMASRVGMSRSSVANFMRLLELPEPVLKLMRSRELSMGHGRALLSLEDGDRIVRLAKLAARRGISVREMEERVRNSGKKGGGNAGRKPSAETPEIRELQEGLQRILKTRVRIRGRGGSGRIEISYHSLEELDRLLSLLKELK